MGGSDYKEALSLKGPLRVDSGPSSKQGAIKFESATRRCIFLSEAPTSDGQGEGNCSANGAKMGKVQNFVGVERGNTGFIPVSEQKHAPCIAHSNNFMHFANRETRANPTLWR